MFLDSFNKIFETYCYCSFFGKSLEQAYQVFISYDIFIIKNWILQGRSHLLIQSVSCNYHMLTAISCSSSHLFGGMLTKVSQTDEKHSCYARVVIEVNY